MESNKRIGTFFFSGLFVSSLLVAPFAIDANLGIRSLSLALIVLFSIIFLKTKEQKRNVPVDLVLLFYFIYTLFSCASTLWSVNSAEALYSSSRNILAFSIFLIASSSFYKNPKIIEGLFLKLMLILFLLSALLAMGQFLNIRSISKALIYGVTGLSAHKNLLSSFLFLNLFFLIYGSITFKGVWKIISILFIGLSVILILILQTKAVWLTLLLSLFFFGICYLVFVKWQVRSRRVFLVSLLTLMVMLNIFFLKWLPNIISTTLSNQTPNTTQSTSSQSGAENERLVLWEKTYDMIRKQPLVGVGNGNWQTHFPDATLSGIWRAEDLDVTFQRPHNDLLWIMSETGIIGLNFYLLFIFSILLLLISNLPLQKGNRTETMKTLLCISFVSGFLLISFFDFPKERIEHTILFNVILAISYVTIRQNQLLKTFFLIPINSYGKLLTLFVLSFVVIVSYLHLQGEVYTRKLYNDRTSNATWLSLKDGENALSFAYSTDPTSVPINWYGGSAHAAMGNYQKAIMCFEKALKVSPYQRNVLNDLGSAYMMRKDPERAKQLYEEAARISPRFDDPKLNLAAIYISEKKYDKAIFWLRAVFHDSPRRSNYYKVIEIQKSLN
ncbi:MAG: O-antigen ligase family protein [bacterium]|nr:O-antigen ligase family protein [bacterium]